MNHLLIGMRKKSAEGRDGMEHHMVGIGGGLVFESSPSKNLSKDRKSCFL